MQATDDSSLALGEISGTEIKFPLPRKLVGPANDENVTLESSPNR